MSYWLWHKPCSHVPGRWTKSLTAPITFFSNLSARTWLHPFNIPRSRPKPTVCRTDCRRDELDLIHQLPERGTFLPNFS